MTGIFHPTRGGNRGGKDQFQWEDVKSDKDRENYLGHSLKAPVGRWQKGKDLIWYTKERGSDEEAKRQKELAAIRDLEAQAMASALGHGAPAVKASQELSKETLQEAFKRNVAEDTLGNTDRVSGMGYKKTLSRSQKGAEYGVAFKRPDELENKVNSADSMQRKRSSKSDQGDDESKSRKKKRKKEKKKKSKKKKSKGKKQLKDQSSDDVSSSESSNDYRSVEEDTPKRKDGKKVQSRSKEKDNEIEGQKWRRDRKERSSDDERLNDGSRHRGSERRRAHHRRDYMKRRHSGDEREIEGEGKRKKSKGKSEHAGYSYDRHGRIHSKIKNIRRDSSSDSSGALSPEEGSPRSKRRRNRHDSD